MMASKKGKVKTDKLNEMISFPARVLEPIKNFLAGEKAKLEKRASELKKADPFRDSDRLIDNAASDTDADEQIGHERSTAMVAQVERRIIQVRKALARIKIGKYGICEKCGKMIDTDRLMVMPETTLCVDCGKKKEK